MAETVEQLIVDLEVRDNASPALKKTREETVKLADKTDKLIGIFKKGDQQFAKVATTIEGIRDRTVRAREATRAFNRAMNRQVNVFDKVADKAAVARARLQSMGAAGKALTVGFTALAAGAAAFVAAVGASAVAAINAFIASEEDAKIATDRLADSYENLKAEYGKLIVGGDDFATNINKTTVFMDLAAEEVADLERNYIALATAIDGATFALGLFVSESDVAKFTANVEGALAVGSQVEEDVADRAQLIKEQIAARKLVDKLLDKQLAEEDRAAARRGKRKPEKAQTEAGFTGSLEAVAGDVQSDATVARLAGINAQSDAMQTQIDMAFEVIDVTRLTTLAQLEADEATQQMTASLENQAAAMAQQAAVAGAVANSFVNIAGGLAEGNLGLKKAGQQLMSSFGDILVQMGTGVVLASEALLALFGGNPIAGLGAGAALIAGGLLIKGAFAAGNKPGGFAKGGAAASSSFAPTFNDFQRDQQKEERQVVQVFIGEQQVAGPVSNIVNDLARRGKLQELAGGRF